MNDTTWFWEIVDAHGLAEVSSDEPLALRQILDRSHRAEAEIEAVAAALGSPRFMDPPDGGDVSIAVQVRRMREQLEKVEKSARAVEAWWLEDGRYAFNGCPYCIFAIRDALVGSGRNRADATNDPASSDLSSLRKGAEELRRKLAGYAITEEYDFPGDAPEFCGFWCNECKEHVEADGSGHRDSCLCHGERPQTARATLVSGSREEQS